MLIILGRAIAIDHETNNDYGEFLILMCNPSGYTDIPIEIPSWYMKLLDDSLAVTMATDDLRGERNIDWNEIVE